MSKIVWVRGKQPAVDIDQAVVSPQVAEALRTWVAATDHIGVLIGDIALAFYVRPRFTDVVEMLYLEKDLVAASVTGFLRRSATELIQKRTATAVHTIFPGESLHSPLVTKVLDSSMTIDGLKVASLHGMISLKLHVASIDRRGGRQECQDIINMICWAAGFELNHLDGWSLNRNDLAKLRELYDVARTGSDGSK